MCRYIPGDANLYSMFRVDSAPIACPFHGFPLAFTYNNGRGECSSPKSEMESCTEPTKLAFHYLACPDVPTTEMRSMRLLAVHIILLASKTPVYK